MAAILRHVNAVTDRYRFASADADDSDAGIGKRRCNRCNRLGLFHFFLHAEALAEARAPNLQFGAAITGFVPKRHKS